MKKKSKSIIKNIGLGCTATLCVATLGLGSFYFVDFAKNGFVKNVSADTDNTQNETPDIENPTTQEFNFKFQDGALVGYSGSMPEKLVIPQTYSISGVEAVSKTLNNSEELFTFCMDAMDAYADSPADTNIFKYVFTDVLGNQTICNTIEDLDMFRMDVGMSNSEAFPISLEYEEKTFCAGTDYLVTEISSSLFSSEGIENVKSISIPKTVTKICSPYSISNATNLKSFVVESENVFFTSIDGVLVEKASNGIVAFPNGMTGDYIMPDNLTFCDSYGGCGSMYRNSKLSSFKINNNVTSILPGMFANCHIGTIILGSGVSSIESMAFEHFEGDEIILNEGLERIGESAFASLKLDTINIPNSVTSIAGGAFYYSSIESIVIPENVTLEGGNWFGNCNNLTTIISYIAPDRLADSNVLSNLPQDITIYVPAERLEEYQNAFASATNITILDITSYTN